MPVSVFSRYHGSQTVNAPGPDGQRLVTSLSLRLPDQTEAFPDSIIHTVVGGETLDQIAQHYYGREDLWWRIMDANDLRPRAGVDGTGVRVFGLEAGDRLIIPPVRTATRFPRS